MQRNRSAGAAPSPRRSAEAEAERSRAYAAALQHKQAGRLAEAEAALEALVAQHPDCAAGFITLAEVLRQRGAFRPALACCQSGLDRDPANLEGRIIRGVILAQSGQLAAAIADLHHVIGVMPDNAGLLVIFGDLLLKQDQAEEAATALRRALRIEPQNATAAANLGTALHRLGHRSEAAAAYRQAIALNPGDARSLSNLAALLSETGDPAGAVGLARQAMALAPKQFGGAFNLAAALSQQGRVAEAIAACTVALQLQPDHAEALALIGALRQQACDWHERAADQAALRERTYALGKPVRPFTVLTSLSDPADHLAAARLWSAAVDRGVTASPKLRRAVVTAPPERLRVGYLSADFHDHATAMLVAEVFELQARERFSPLGYALRPDSPGGSALRTRIVAALDDFVDLTDLADEAAARRIAADGVDILVDLKGHTAAARTGILAFRPAPLQVNFLGFPGSMGAPFIDYIIADAVVAPFAEAHLFDEKIVHLPHCYQPNDRQRPVAPAPKARAACGLPPQAFVFCCFNNSYKITPEIFDIWMQLLNEIAGAVLWLLDTDALARTNLRREASARGVDPDRLIFAPRIAPDRHLARLDLADLFLDTLPVNAHTTASDALWAGLPVLTLPGNAFVGRVAASLLQAIGLPELVARSLAEYAAIARGLARDPAALAALRRRLIANRSTAPLFDTPRTTRAFEAALLHMAERQRAGLPPQAFAVPDQDIAP